MLFLSPTIVNDGHMLIISPQPISYMTYKTDNTYYDGIEFTRLFSEQDSKNLKFTSALRMNATFPYILPMVSLPSDPPIEIMDAGFRDNYGLKTSIKFIENFKNWIAK